MDNKIYKRDELDVEKELAWLHTPMTPERKALIDKAMEKVFEDYGETLRMLGRDD